MKRHKLILDYDGMSIEEVRADAARLRDGHPELGDFNIEPSDKPNCWHLFFHKSELTWNKALVIAKESRCDKDWLSYRERCGCLALVTGISKSLQPEVEVVNPSIEEIKSPVKLVVTPGSELDLRRLIRLCESIPDKEWVWNYYTPAWDMITRVEIGCRDEPQAIRRLKWLSQRIKAKFEVNKSG